MDLPLLFLQIFRSLRFILFFGGNLALCCWAVHTGWGFEALVVLEQEGVESNVDVLVLEELALLPAELFLNHDIESAFENFLFVLSSAYDALAAYICELLEAFLNFLGEVFSHEIGCFSVLDQHGQVLFLVVWSEHDNLSVHAVHVELLVELELLLTLRLLNFGVGFFLLGVASCFLVGSSWCGDGNNGDFDHLAGIVHDHLSEVSDSDEGFLFPVCEFLGLWLALAWCYEADECLHLCESLVSGLDGLILGNSCILLLLELGIFILWVLLWNWHKFFRLLVVDGG